jgi:hypothetical protein
MINPHFLKQEKAPKYIVMYERQKKNNQPILYCTIKEYKIQKYSNSKKHVTIIFEAINLFDEKKTRRKESKSMYGWVLKSTVYYQIKPRVEL